MKRHPGLAQLSREHHTALMLAKHALNAASDTPDAQSRMSAEIAIAFAKELDPHFKTEERGLLPALKNAGQFEAVDRTLSDHATLRELARRIAAREHACLKDFGELLEAHVRFEERELFPLAESKLPADANYEEKWG